MTREQILQRQQELVNTAKTQNRDLSPEEQAEFDNLQRELDNPAQEGHAASGERSAQGAAQPDPEQIAQRAVEAERRRTSEITSLCRDFHIEPGKYIANGSSIEEVRTAIIEQLQKANAPVAAGNC